MLPTHRPLVMGIVNVTPDSFSDGGDFVDPQRAVAHAKSLVEQGADLLDLGAESTRPGARPISDTEELRRILPVLDAILNLGVPVSVDTRRALVMTEVLKRPIAMINDVNALQDAQSREACAQSSVAVCLMHMQGDPQTMQLDPTYEKVAPEVFGFLRARADACERAGIAAHRICLDPGFGFGKTLAHSIELMRALPELCAGNYPILVGWSRKRVLGEITGQSAPKVRTAASVAAALRCADKGAKILRVHDVRETVDALRVWQTLQ